MKRKVTIEDVARTAAVSPATVSRCLNNPGAVSAALRERVDLAIADLDYVPHGAARALASRRSRMLGAVFPSLDSGLFGGALDAFQSELAAAGYTLVVASSNYDSASEQEHIRKLVTSGIDALLLVGAVRDPGIYRMLERKSIPYVLTWIAEDGDGSPCIGFDNAHAAAIVARHLMDMGHRRLAVISGIIENNDRAAARLAGIADALAHHGLELPDDLVIQRPFGVDEGRDAFRTLMHKPDPPTAVICGSEPFAYGAIFESRRLGIAIPDDVSITGFDDMWLASQTSPTLTTVRTPRRRMGELAARYLLSVLAGAEVSVPASLDVELIVRQSTGPPPSSLHRH